MTPKFTLAEILESGNNLFKNKNAVKPNYALGSIDNILHRDAEIRTFFEYLKDIFYGVSPSNVFLYGKPGLGKTALTTLILDEIIREAENRGIDLCVININCDEIRTEHAIIQRITRELPLPAGEKRRVIGNSIAKHNTYFKELVDSYPGIIIIVFDELDKAVNPDMINRIIRTQSKASGQFPTVIGITNDLELKDRFSPHLKSVLCENGLIINPYNALQLTDILRARAEIAFKPDVVPQDVISLCAAYAAQEYGDVRRAIDLLRVSGEIAESKKHSVIEEEDVRAAHDKLELDKIIEVVKTLPTQSKTALLACIYVDDIPKENDTNNIYTVYKAICQDVGIDILTQRRMNDLLSELNQLGIIEESKLFKGRYGRKKVITKISSKELVLKTLYQDFHLSDIAGIPKRNYLINLQ